MHNIIWQKSSYSAAGETSCVEIASQLPDALLIRESDDPDVILSTAPAAVGALLLALKAGQYYRASPPG
jgi:hypothetical protein